EARLAAASSTGILSLPAGDVALLGGERQESTASQARM
ncbi:MAG: hypothetical protein AVDCRST_MAG17-428, partial [uncultured Solirubrobacterales bacterium]